MKMFKLRLLTICVILISQQLIAQTDYIGATFKLPPHPRILMKDSEVNAVKKNSGR